MYMHHDFESLPRRDGEEKNREVDKPTEHILFENIEPSDAEGRIRFIIVALDGHFPVMNALTEAS